MCFITGERSRLKYGAVPSVFDFKSDTSQESKRSKRMRLRGSTQDTETREDLQMDEMTIHEVILDQASSGTSSEQDNLKTQYVTAEKEFSVTFLHWVNFQLKA